MTRVLHLLRRAAGKPPGLVARRAAHELGRELERFLGPRRARRLDDRALLRLLRADSPEQLVSRVIGRPFPAVCDPIDPAAYERACPGDAARIRAAADRALAREVDLLGSGPVALGTPVDWHVDPKTGDRWGLGYGPRLEYARLEEPCDVKLPWEISRLQWLIPSGQAFLLDGDERHAEGVRTILEEWLTANPYPLGVNWAIAMEPAIRLVTLAWLFRAFGRSTAWDTSFRMDIVRALFLHADFVDRHIELAEVNGNHLDADAMALVVAGLLLGDAPISSRWAERGWTLLVSELPRQVTSDGVDFEASTAYHRLVCELFLLPAAMRRAHGLHVPPAYVERLRAMAKFAASYARTDGTTPLWGDADDARVLPFGPQPGVDHRYLPSLVDAQLATCVAVSGPRAEIAWIIGPESAATLSEEVPPSTRLFREGGVAVLRGGGDHVFVDCGPVGLAGRGGHGHNDCLSFEASLDGVLLISDSGSYVYTACPAEREAFRATASHSTPQVNGEELNRLVGSLWALADDARPDVRVFSSVGSVDRITAAHSGYERLAQPVTPVRTVVLDRNRHVLAVLDGFEGEGEHHVRIPWHLAAGVEAEVVAPGQVLLTAENRRFVLAFADPCDWTIDVQPAWVSPSYGVRHASLTVVAQRSGTLRPLLVGLAEQHLDALALARALMDAP